MNKNDQHKIKKAQYFFNETSIYVILDMECEFPLKIRENDDGNAPMIGNYACYCLFSRSNPHRVYTGYTNNFSRRLKEHNTSSKGAKHTHEGRPYFPLLIVSGFMKRKQAMRFEKCMKKRRSRKHTRGLLGRMATLMNNLRNKEWRDTKLRVLCMFKKEQMIRFCVKKDATIKAEFVFREFGR